MKLCLICNFQTAGEQDICPRDGSSMVTVGDDPLLGVVVEGRYKIESVIGQGSAGTVYRAVQELIGREVAIKVLHDYLVSDQEFIKRFTQEAKASSRLSHPNIITIYDFGVIPKGGRPYIAMDLLRGTPLSDLILEREHLSVEEAVPIFKQVCGALAEAHRQGVVHRDIKPENIVLVERSGQKLFPIVVDFGIARLVQEESDVARITRTGTVCGSPTYMSPEQCTSSKVDQRSDIYSLGIVIYETLTGEVPFLSDELVKVMAMHLSDPPKPLNSVREDLQFSSALEEVVYKTLAKNPDHRYQTMEELSDALDKAMKEPEAAPPVAAPAPKRPEITPGPLAQDDDLTVAARPKQNMEMVAPKPKASDLASSALENLKTSGAYTTDIADQVNAVRQAQRTKDVLSDPMGASAATMSQVNFARGRAQKKTVGSSIQSFGIKGFLITFVVIGLIAVGIFAATDMPKFISVVPIKQITTEEIQSLIDQSKFEDALEELQAYKKQQKDKVDAKAVNEMQAKISVNLAKQYAKSQRYKEACKVLNDVPAGTQQSDAIKKLLKRYQKIISS